MTAIVGSSCVVLLIVAVVLMDAAVNASSVKSKHAKSKHGGQTPASSGISRQLATGPGMALSTSCITGLVRTSPTTGVVVSAKPCKQDGVANPLPPNTISTGCTAMLYEFTVSTCKGASTAI